MSLILIVSILLRVLAVGWSVARLRPMREWRMGLFTLMLFMMALRQLATLIIAVSENGDWALEMGGHLSELPGLVASMIALLLVLYLDSMRTDPRQVESELRQSESNDRSIFELASVGMALADVQTGRYVAVNKKLCAMTGYTAEELRQKTIYEVTHPDDHKRIEFPQLVRGELSETSFEKRYLRRDGSVIWVDVNATLTHGSNGKPERAVAVIRDITERKWAEQALRNSEELYRAVFELAGVGIGQTDAASGRFVRVNRKLCDITGYSSEELEQKTFSEITHPDDREPNQAGVLAMVRGETPGYTVEKRYIRKDGSLVWVYINATVIRDADGNPQRTIAVIQDITQRKQQEESLRQSEARNRALLKAIPDFMFRLRGDGIFVDYLANQEEKLAVPPQQFMNRSIRDCMPGEVAELMMINIGRALETRKMQLVEYRLPNSVAPNEPCDFEARIIASDADEVIVIVRDITDRKCAEQRLRESQRSLAQSQRIAHMGSWEWEIQNDRAVWSDELYRIVGVDRDDATDQDGGLHAFLQRYVHPDDYDRVLLASQKAISTGRPEALEFRIIRPDGSERIVDTEAEMVTGSDGNPVRIIGTLQDITERKRVEMALRESETRSRVVLEKSPTMVAILQGNDWRYVNPAIEMAMGYSSEELMQMSFLDIVHPDHRNLVAERSRRRQRGESVSSRYEFKYINKQGETRWLDFAAELIEYEGKPAVLATAIDVTFRKVAEEQLREKEVQLAHVSRLSSMGELVAGIAHEVNQPLYSILNYAKASANVLGRMNERNAEQLRQWNEEIGQAAHRAGEITKRLRRFVSQKDMERVPTNIADVIHESAQLVAFEARRCGTRMELQLASQIPSVRVDRVQIQQILINLMKNAYEAMDEAKTADRRVTIRTQVVGHQVEVVVADTGPGIHSDKRTSLFDAFSTTKLGGMGMGLAISKSIVERHGGQLWVSSDNGGGASFHFTLPIDDEGENDDR